MTQVADERRSQPTRSNRPNGSSRHSARAVDAAWYRKVFDLGKVIHLVIGDRFLVLGAPLDPVDLDEAPTLGSAALMVTPATIGENADLLDQIGRQGLEATVGGKSVRSRTSRL